MNIRRWEDIHNFIDDVFGKLQCLLITATQDFIKDTKLGSCFIRTTRTTQLRIGSQSRQHVPRHINFRYHRNKTVGSILYNFLGFFLRIIAAYRNAVVFVGSRSRNCFLPMRTNLCQFRVFLDLDTPTLVFRQVPMEIIDIVHSQHINDFLQIIYREKVASDIYHKPAVSETRIILNRSCRNSSQRLSVCYRKRLVNCLDTIENSSFSRPFHGNSVSRNLQFVSVFLRRNRCINLQCDRIFPTLCSHLHVCPRHFPDIRSQKMSRPLQLFIAFGITDHGR